MKNLLIPSLIFILVLSTVAFMSCKKKSTTEVPVLGPGDEALPYTNTSWMAKIDDTRHLNEISIPGTHDCAADSHTSDQAAAAGLVYCQDYYISNQLLLGVRWFDVRLCLTGGNLLAYHGPYYLHKNFNDLLNAALNFINSYPTETVIFMVKQENSSAGDDEFGGTLLNYLSSHSSDLSKFYIGHVLPMLGLVRGKIVICCRYANWKGTMPGMYVDWDDNTSGENIDQCDYPLWVQDHYSMNSVSFDTKSNEIRSGISFAQNANNNRLYLNFCSGEADVNYIANGYPSIWDIAANVNQNIEYYLAANPTWQHLGVLYLNYAGGSDIKDNSGNRTVTTNFVNHIIEHNDTTVATVQVGSQVWMKRDLCNNRFRNGDTIPHVKNGTPWGALTSAAYTDYNDTIHGDYGHLYNYYAVNDPRGLCPKGFHVPTDDEWNTLINYGGGTYYAGALLKEPGYTHWQYPNYGAYNTCDFKALPGGFISQDGFEVSFMGQVGFWWSATNYSGNGSTFLMDLSDTQVSQNNYDMRQGHSVRCIKN